MQAITKDMPEPQEPGMYLLHTAHCDYGLTKQEDDEEWGEGPWQGSLLEDADWETVVLYYPGCTIESIAEHDERIRREALTVSATTITTTVDTNSNTPRRR